MSVAAAIACGLMVLTAAVALVVVAWEAQLKSIATQRFLSIIDHDDDDNNNDDADSPTKQKTKTKMLDCLLVIAHPDDESMFFMPMLLHLKPHVRWHLLCLSSGKQRHLNTYHAWLAMRQSSKKTDDDGLDS
jgi:hypothetical protein